MMGLSVQEQRLRQGLHYMNPRQDLKEVVDLLQEVFAPYMDSEGRYVLQEMRLMARLASWLGSWAMGPGVYGSALVGFVWLENGHVVGHVTVQRLDYEGIRWQIANVAVAEPYRGRGIGRALMDAALEHIRRLEGTWAVLQVRANNEPALHLYRSLGFETVGGEARYVCTIPALNRERLQTPRLVLQPLSFEHLGSVRDLYARSLGPDARWWRRAYPARPPYPGLRTWLKRLVGWITTKRLGYWEGNQLMAVLDVFVDRKQREGIAHIAVDSRAWGRWEEDLVAWAMGVVERHGGTRMTIPTDLDYEPLVHTLEAAGFEEEFCLLNMRLRVKEREGEELLLHQSVAEQ